MEHGITAPRYTENPLYKVTNNDYEEFPGELTQEGFFEMEQFGKQLRKEFIEQQNFLPDEFRPENFYHKTYRDEPSMISAYTTMLGTYPDSISWIQYQSMGGQTQEPFDREDEIEVRKALRLSTNPSSLSTREITIWAEIDGKTFFNDPYDNCPKMQEEFTQNLDKANAKYTANKQFDGLYNEMSKTFEVPREKINFKTAHLFLDDYTTSQANKKPVPKFDDMLPTEVRIRNYHETYLYEGKLGTSDSIARVASDSFLNYVLTAMYGKVETLNDNLKNSHYEHLKYSQFTGNENAIAAVNKILGNDPDGPPTFGSNIRFELFESNGKYYVKCTNDGNPMDIGSSNDGVMDYEEFMDYIYQRLYFGDVDKYCSGQEEASQHSYPSVSSYKPYLKSNYDEFAHVESKGRAEISRQEQSAETRHEGYYEQEFTEVKQKQTYDDKKLKYATPRYSSGDSRARYSRDSGARYSRDSKSYSAPTSRQATSSSYTSSSRSRKHRTRPRTTSYYNKEIATPTLIPTATSASGK